MFENQLNQLNLAQIRAAHQRKSSLLAKMICTLASQPRYFEEHIAKGALTFEDYLKLRDDYPFQQLSSIEKQQKRQQLMAQLESLDAAIALPESLKLHEFLLELWHNLADHAILCRLLTRIPFNYGAWRGIKHIFKQAEITQNWTVYGVILARLDRLATDPKTDYEISLKTAGYLVRRGWRTMRRLSDLNYAAAMTQVLRHYPQQFNAKMSTVIIKAFSAKAKNIDKLQCFENRLSAWQGQISCLYVLLVAAKNIKIQQGAMETLKQHCAMQLRQMPINQLLILAQPQQALIDEFLVWLLQSEPRFEQSRLKALGLHELCLNLLNSKAEVAAEYAVAYAKVYERNLTLNQLLPLLDSKHKAVYQLAQALIAQREAQKAFSFADWGKILETEHGYQQANLALITYYTPQQFDHDWLIARLQAVESRGFHFACALIEQKEVELSPTEYLDLLLNKASLEFGCPLIAFVFSRLHQIDLSSLKGSHLLQSLLLMEENITEKVMDLIKSNKLTLDFWSLDFLKSFVDDTYWQPSSNWAWLEEQSRNFVWTNQIVYPSSLVETMLKYLGDVRSFSSKDLGVDWLLALTEHKNSMLVGFASDYLNRVFRPADFAPITALDKVDAGCEQLWQFLTQSKKASRRQFALSYVQQHHLELSKAHLGLAVDSTAQMPSVFFTLERITQLFHNPYPNVRALGVELAKWHLHEWTKDLPTLFKLCLHQDAAIASLIVQGFTCEEKFENRYIHLNAQAITINHLLLLCENQASALRGLGLYLLQTHQHLQKPNELLSLLESADPKIRAAVIRLIAKVNGFENKSVLGDDQQHSFLFLLRRALFEIPPNRGKPNSKHSVLKLKLKALPARDAKRKLLETLRDIAIERIGEGKPQLAQALMPLLKEFAQSRGQSEFAACLVAQTRISHALAAKEKQEALL